MASYSSLYLRELYPNPPILIKNTVLLFTISDNKELLSEVSPLETDNAYLPSLFLQENPIIKSEKEAYCTLLNRARKVKLYISASSYLELFCPYLPGTDSHLIFFQQAKNNSIFKITTSGERYANDLTRRYAKAN